MTKLFAFGTLLNPRVQLDVFGRLVPGRIAELKGVYIDHSGTFPRLAGWPGVTALGRVLELNDEEVQRAARYEGPDWTLSEVTLVDGTRAMVFV